MQVYKIKYLFNNYNIIHWSRRSICTINRFFSEYQKINRNINNHVPLVTLLCVQSKIVPQHPILHNKLFSTSNQIVDSVTFEKVCDETLESLCEYFEELVESSAHLQSADVEYGSGILTVNFGSPYGTYVINRQSPNQQIWLSSPTSGPKRYDFVADGNYWLYKHDHVTLHQLLQDEIKPIIQRDIDFSKCAYCLLTK